MRYVMKQKMFSFGDDFIIKDGEGNDAFSWYFAKDSVSPERDREGQLTSPEAAREMLGGRGCGLGDVG